MNNAVKVSILVSIVLISVILCICASNMGKEITYCTKCGREATCTFSGTGNDLQKRGFNLSKCTEISNGIYSTPCCEYCAGDVVEFSNH